MQLPYTVKAKKAIDIAGKMSKSLHHNYIGTEHLLIGLLKENSGVAAKILKRLSESHPYSRIASGKGTSSS